MQTAADTVLNNPAELEPLPEEELPPALDMEATK